MYAVCKIACDFKTVTSVHKTIVDKKADYLCQRFNYIKLAEKDEQVADLLMGKSENHGFQRKIAELTFKSEYSL